jgi:hypothetical protein
MLAGRQQEIHAERDPRLDPEQTTTARLISGGGGRFDVRQPLKWILSHLPTTRQGDGSDRTLPRLQQRIRSAVNDRIGIQPAD